MEGSIITNDLVKIEYRAVYQSYINVFYGLGASCGAAFGGFLCDKLGWRWTFGIQVPAVLLILICGFFTVSSDLGPNLARNSNQRWYQTLKEFDLAGSFTLTLTTACLILGLNLGGNIFPWRHPVVITALCLSLVASSTLIWVESRAKWPIMPLSILLKPPRANLLFSNFFTQIGVNTIIFNAPLYFQAVKLDTPSMSGFRLAAPSALMTVFAVATGFFIAWTGRMKSPQVLGAVCELIGAICLSCMWEAIPTWLATIFVIPPGLGQVCCFTIASS